MASVVRAEDGVDGEFGAECACVSDHEGEGREGGERFECGADSWFFDEFPASGLKDVVFMGLHFRIVTLTAAARNGGRIEFDGVVGGTAAGVHTRGTSAVVGCAGAAVCGVEGAEEGVADVEGALEILFSRRPTAGGGVRAGEYHDQGCDGDEDEGDDESNSPGGVGGYVLGTDERIHDCGHNEVGDAAPCVAEASGEGVCSAHDFLVEEAGRPDLTGNEAATEDADEKAEDGNANGRGCGAGEGCGDGPDEEDGSEGYTGAVSIAGWSSDETDKESGGQADDVGVGDVGWGEGEVVFDGFGE